MSQVKFDYQIDEINEQYNIKLTFDMFAFLCGSYGDELREILQSLFGAIVDEEEHCIYFEDESRYRAFEEWIIERHTMKTLAGEEWKLR